MSWRRKLDKQPRERDRGPIVVAWAFPGMSAPGFWVPNPDLAGTVRDSGIISAIFRVIYWLANPGGADG